MPRNPAVAGMFYDYSEEALRISIEECFLSKLGPGSLPNVSHPRVGNILGLICPHAGYVYSGPGAAHSFFALANDGMPDIFILLGPNHTALGAAVSISNSDLWHTPLGDIAVDRNTALNIINRCAYAKFDDLAHSKEHSIEVQLPFIQYLAEISSTPTPLIIPISVAHLSLDDSKILAEELGSAIAETIAGKSAVIIASSDMTHYEPAQSAIKKDEKALKKVLNLDAQGLLEIAENDNISMCGVIPTAIMITACKKLGASKSEILTHYTSGDVMNMRDVVGYAAGVIKK